MRKTYKSTKRNTRRKNKAVKSVAFDWADYKPRRDYGVYANARTTYSHNGETRLT